MNIESVSPQLPKSGTRAMVCAGSCATRPDRPPTSGCASAKYAAANAPAIAIPNWKKSTTSTPHSPDVAAKTMLITAQISSVLPIGQPSTTLAILAAARLTVAMMKQLKTRPR